MAGDADMSAIAKWAILVILGLNVILSIQQVGRPRTPTTPSVAIGVLILNSLIAAAILIYWGES